MSDGTNGLARFWAAVGGHVDARAEPRRARRVLTIATIERDSTGAAVTARGTIGGEGDFSIDVRGRGVREGMRIGVVGPANDPYAPLAFADIDQTDDPSAAYGDVNADLPVPTFASTPFTTVIVKSPGSVTARGSVFFNAVAERYHPDYYLLSWRLTSGPGEWRDEKVPHLGGVQECNLGSAFAPGVQIDVKLRAHYDWALSFSVASATSTFTLASDNASPGSASGLAVDLTIAGQMILTPSGSLDASLFDHWQYEFNTTGSGAATDTKSDRGQLVYRPAAGTYYARVVPVSKSGTVGTYYPGPTSWLGPYVITVAAAPLDTTPPPVFGAPTLTQRSVTDANGTIRYFIKVTLPAYSFPADYFETEVSLSDGTNPPILAHITGTGTTGEWVMVPGTWTIGLRGVDQSGNRQSGFGTTANITVTPIGTPATMSAPTVTAKAGAMLIEWTRPTDAKWVRVTRATSAGGAGATVLGIFDSTAFLDILLTNGDVSGGYPTWYYATTAINLDSSGAIRAGTISSYTGAAVLATHGSWLGADTITAREILANTITANEIAATLSITGNTIQTAASGARVAMSGPNNRFEVYGASAMLAYLDGADLRFLRDGNTSHPRTKFTASGQVIYNDSDVLRTQLDKDGLLIFNAGAAANRVQLQPDTVMQLFGDDASSGLFLGYSAAPISLLKTLVGGSQYTTGCWVNQAQGLVFSNSATQGGTPGAYLSLRPDGKLGFGTGANFADVLLARMNGGYGLGLDLDQGSLHAKDIYATRNGGATGYVFLGDQSGGARYVGYDGSNYVMPNSNLYVNGSIVLTSSRALKEQIRALPAMREKLRALTPKRFRRTDRPSTRDEYGYIAEEVEVIAPHAVTEMDLTPPPTRDQDGNEVAAEPVIVKGLNPLALLAVIHQGLSEGLAALEARVAALEARGGTP